MLILLNRTKQIRSHNVLLRGIQIEQDTLMERRDARPRPDEDLDGQFALRRNCRVDDLLRNHAGARSVDANDPARLSRLVSQL